MLKHNFLKDVFVIWKDGLLNSFGKYLLSIYYVLGIALGIGDSKVKKTDIVLLFYYQEVFWYILSWIIYIKKYICTSETKGNILNI